MEPHDESQQEDHRRPVGIGSRYATEFVKGPPMVMECRGYERPSAWSLLGRSSALRAGGGGRVLPAADGSHLIMRMELEPRGLLRLAAPLPRRRMKPMLEGDLANIKSVVEGRPGSRTASVACEKLRLEDDKSRWGAGVSAMIGVFGARFAGGAADGQVSPHLGLVPHRGVHGVRALRRLRPPIWPPSRIGLLEKPAQQDLSLMHGPGGLAVPERAAGQRVGARVHAHAERAAR